MNDLRVRLFLLPLAAAALILAGCGGGGEEQAAGGDAAGGQDQAAAGQPFGIGKPAPDFTLTDIHGEAVSLSDHRGKAVVVDFWATWCGPCRRVMPTLEALSRDYADELSVLAVSLDQDPAQVVPPFAQKHGLTFPLLADPAAMQVAQDWGGIRSIPTSFLVAPDGTLVKKWVGAHGRETYESEIQRVLGKAS